VPTLTLRPHDVVRLLKAASWAQVFQSRLRVDWVPQEGALQNVYGALHGLFGTPGTPEVVLPDMGRVDDEVRRLAARRIDVFFDKCELGPGPAGEYLAAMDGIRTAAMAAAQETFRDTAAIGRDVARRWGVSVAVLAGTQLASTVVVKTAGLVFSPAGGWAVDAGFDIAVATLPELASGGKGKAVAFVDEVREKAEDEAKEEGGGRFGEKVVDAINRRSTEAELRQAYQRMAKAEGKLRDTLRKIADRRQQLAAATKPAAHRARQSLATLERRVAPYTAGATAARAGLARAGAARAAAKGVSFVFFAGDLIEAFEQHVGTMRSALE
jgi:hypothetical protein